MAEIRVFSRLFSCFCCVLCFICLTRAYNALLPEFPTHVFQRHIKVSRHQPFCVVFRNASTGSKLEKVAYNLWYIKPAGENFTTWQFGAFSPATARMPPNNVEPRKLPSMRCYLGESSSYQYGGKVRKTDLRNWLTKLSSLYAEQSAEVTEERIKEAQKMYQVLLLAFPDGPRHHEVEDMIYGMANEMDSCKAMAVHLNSAQVGLLRQRFVVNKYPSVVVIHNKVINGTVQEDFQVFSGHDVKPHVMKVYLTAYSVTAPLLTLDTFEYLLHGNKSDTDWEFQPLLVCFYSHWASDVFGYLYAYNVTVQQYQQDLVKLKYGLVDLTKDTSKILIRRHIRSGAMKQIPFLALFYKDSGGSLKSTYLHIGRPYPWVMYEPIKNLGEGLVELFGIEEYSDPWGTLPYDQYSSIQEGPHGRLCTAWAHNMTDNTPVIRKPVVKKKRIIKKPVIIVKQADPVKKSVHDVFDTDTLERKLSVYENIPLLTRDTWTDIVEKSHAPRHIFYKSGKWAGEVTKVSLVVFIMADCGNCRRNNQTFRDIQQAVTHIDGGSMYYVNCTAEPLLCRSHNVRGFPTVVAYRGLGWMDTTKCLTKNSQKMFKKYVRMDYHGVIRAEPVLEWFSRVADNSVINVHSDHLPTSFLDKDVWLIASVSPATGDETFWSYPCLRLLCERLYSVLDCFSISVGALPENADVVVTKLTLERRDNVKAVVMEHGVPLLDTMENPENELLHRFHKPHSYTINASQTCEEDVATCTDVVTEFILDHSRMPVTPLTSDMFHTSTSVLKEEGLPILIAMANTDNLTESATFLKDLTSVAYDLYNDIIVMTLDAEKYPKWASKFVPALYSHTRMFESDELDPLSLFVFPRLVIVNKNDHKHAALYPPTTRRRKKNEKFSVETILTFAQSYLQEPESWIIETEHF
ncbi:uncharacterized protein LOC123525859 [Mercenaria mercenaria]|uniref:uncharacterized protein LOC123525859 n=1 Tax=Mercenaria mercenaria TaxID=6596 RepID=UPI00234EF2EF|nr:uncharacterized protein LOC123525859 [Mercenaria mercenaria]